MEIINFDRIYVWRSQVEERQKTEFLREIRLKMQNSQEKRKSE